MKWIWAYSTWLDVRNCKSSQSRRCRILSPPCISMTWVGCTPGCCPAYAPAAYPLSHSPCALTLGPDVGRLLR